MGKQEKKPKKAPSTPTGWKQPRTAIDPVQKKKIPRPPMIDPDEAGQCSPSWRFSSIDFEGPWGWGVITVDVLRELRDRLRSFESMKWVELERQRSTHSMPTNVICKDARDRLEAIELDEVDHLYQLSFGNMGRIFGIRHRHVFDLLWWDPEHTVYPVEKKHT